MALVETQMLQLINSLLPANTARARPPANPPDKGLMLHLSEQAPSDQAEAGLRESRERAKNHHLQ